MVLMSTTRKQDPSRPAPSLPLPYLRMMLSTLASVSIRDLVYGKKYLADRNQPRALFDVRVETTTNAHEGTLSHMRPF